MHSLSKSKILAYRQCPRRLWLEIHRPDLSEDSASTEAHFQVGIHIGEVAQQLYDPKNLGVLIDPHQEGFKAAFARTARLLESSQPIFEATFMSDGALVLADVMLPKRKAGMRCWRMIEIKSSTTIKDYHLDDVAIQAFIAKSANVSLVSVAVAHIDSSWVYPGDGNYNGLLIEHNLTKEAFGRNDKVRKWIAEAQSIAAKKGEPKTCTGSHCANPYSCGFLEYCGNKESQVDYPVGWLPRVQSYALKSLINENGVADMRDVPDELLNQNQLLVKTHTLSGETFFDADGAANDLSEHKLPAYFLDFETIVFAIPIWKGTRPYQQIPFQFSLHKLNRSSKLSKKSFIDLSGNDPSSKLAHSLVSNCGIQGPVFVYNAGFETARIRELAKRFPRLKKPLLAINERIVDLLVVARARYYHPSQHGSWSIKQVLPAIAPDLCYDELDGVQDGNMAMHAFLEAIYSETDHERKQELKNQLIKYCELDTFAMVRLWQFFSGRNDLNIQ